MDLTDTKPLEDRAQALLEAAMKAGANEADALAVRGVSLGVEVRDGTLEESERSEGDSLSLRVLIGKKSAIVSTNETAMDGFPALAEQAVAIAQAAPENPFTSLADSQLLASHASRHGGAQALDLVDDQQPDADTLRAAAEEIEKHGMAIDGVTKSGGASASWGLSGVVLATSAGFSGAYMRSRHGRSMTAIAGSGTEMERDYAFHSVLHHTDLETPEEIGKEAAERTVKRMNPRKIKTMRAPVIIDKRVSSSLLGHLTGAINGSAIARKASFLMEKMGERVFPETIEITDDPLRHRGLGSRPFDAEGVAASPLPIVNKGALTTWLLDTSTAQQLDLRSNGRASRSSGSAPSPSSTNVTLAKGTETPEAMMKRLGSGLLITGFIGRGVNMVTGDYSRGASGFWFENGEIAYPVSEITVAGNLLDMFASLEPANDLEFRGTSNAPSVFVGEMTIAGE